MGRLIPVCILWCRKGQPSDRGGGSLRWSGEHTFIYMGWGLPSASLMLPPLWETYKMGLTSLAVELKNEQME